jgi:hypothetical protein
MYWLRVAAGDTAEEGVAVLRRGLVNGGGPGYVWQGRLLEQDGAVRGNLVVRIWNPSASSGVGMFKAANLAVQGRLDASARAFELERHAHGHHVVHLRISGHWLGELAEEGPSDGRDGSGHPGLT